MSDKVKIARLEVQDFQRVRTVAVDCDGNPLVLLAGKNEQGKTTILDAMAYSLGGNRLKPQKPERDGADGYPNITVELDNGLVVNRSGKNGRLKVTDKDGMSGNQSTLDKIISKIALDLPQFLNADDKNRVRMFLDTLGIDEDLADVDAEIARVFDNRRDVNKEVKRLRAVAETLRESADMTLGTEEIEASDLWNRLEWEEEKNREIDAKIDEAKLKANNAETETRAARDHLSMMEAEVQRLEELLAKAKEDAKKADAALSKWVRAENEARQAVGEAEKLAEQKETPDATRRELAHLSDKNRVIQTNREIKEAEAEADKQQASADSMTTKIANLRKSRSSLFEQGNSIVEGLSVSEDGSFLMVEGVPWSQSGASRKRIIAAQLAADQNPRCGFVLVDKLEELDSDRLSEFREWLADHDLQGIGTAVGSPEGSTVIIEDGMVKE